MSTSGDVAKGTTSEGGQIFVRRDQPIYGVQNNITPDKMLNGVTLFTGPTGASGTFSWDGDWSSPEVRAGVLRQSGNWVIGNFNVNNDREEISVRAYAFGDTLVGTVVYSEFDNVRDFKLKMGPDGISATGTMWYVGHPDGRQEIEATFEKYHEQGRDPLTNWNVTAVPYSYTGSWNLNELFLGADRDKLTSVTLEFEQSDDLSVTGTVNGNEENIIEGKVVGRNLYAAFRIDGFYGHFRAQISADGTIIQTYSGQNGYTGFGGTGERILP